MVEIRTYDGDGTDLEELCLRVRTGEGDAGKWEPLWNAAYIRRQILAPAKNRELAVAAYDSGRLVGAFFAVPYRFRVRGRSLPGSFSTCLIVDPAYRGLTPYVIEKLRRRHRENGIAFSLGFVMGQPGSGPYECWTGYAKAYPKNCRFVSDAGNWIAAFDISVLDDASREERDRAVAQLTGQRGGDNARPSGIKIRAFRPDDLPACLELAQKQVERADWAIDWDETALMTFLEKNQNGTAFVAEHDGTLCGLVNYHQLPLWNGAPVGNAVFDLLATAPGKTAAGAALLDATCKKARDEGAQLATALRSSMFRARTMIPAGFLPSPDSGRLVVLFSEDDIEAGPSENYELLLR